MKCVKQKFLMEPSFQLVNDSTCISSIDRLKASTKLLFDVESCRWNLHEPFSECIVTICTIILLASGEI